MKKKLYLLTCFALCFLVGCNEDEEKTYPSYISRFVWVNECDYSIEYFKISGCFTKEWGIGRGQKVVKEVKGSVPMYLDNYLGGKETIVYYDSFMSGIKLYAYADIYSPTDPENATPKNLQDWSRYVYEGYEEGDTYVMVWTYTFTNADYEVARAKEPIVIAII